jgi:hypothetical protein
VQDDGEIDPSIFDFLADPRPDERLIERDPNQECVPAGFDAFIFRWRHSVIEGALIASVKRIGIRLVFGLENTPTQRPLRDRTETSRVFVRHGGVEDWATDLFADPITPGDGVSFAPYDFHFWARLLAAERDGEETQS